MVFGHEVHSLGAHCLCLDHKARHESLACGEDDMAVRFRCLVGGAAHRDLSVLVGLHGFDEDLERLADPLLGTLRGELLGQLRDVGEAFGDDVGVELVLVSDGLGALLVGVTEDTDGVQPRSGQEALQLGEVRLGLPGKPTMKFDRAPACGALPRMVSRSSRKRSVSPNLRIARSTPGAECWKERSK